MAKLLTLLAVLCAGAMPQSATAQMNLPSVGEYPRNVYVPSVDEIVGKSEADADSAAAADERPTVESNTSDGDVRQSAALSFPVSLTRLRANYARFIAGLRVRDRGGAAELERVFAQHDVIELVNGQMRHLGLSTNNVADAFAIWATNAWLASRGRNDDLPEEALQAVSAQMARALLLNPAFVSATDADKQQLAETYLIQAMLIGAAAEKVVDDPDQSSTFAASVRQGAKSSGLDVSDVELTHNGFIPRS